MLEVLSMTGADSWIYKKDRGDKIRARQIRKHKKQRAERGWSTFDWWNADTFILDVIADMADEFAANGVGYPGRYTEAEWADVLSRICDPLRIYVSGKFPVDSSQAHRDATAALHLFADHFAHFWD